MALTAVSTAFLPRLRAQEQSPEEVTSLLTTGTWHFHSRSIARHFKSDGTFTSSNGSAGRWQLRNGELLVTFGTSDTHIYFLPINPNGTPGQYRGQPDFLVRDPLDTSMNPSSDPPNGVAAFTTEPIPSATPIPADVQRRASQVIQAYHDSLVFVTGSAAAGSGFIASMDGHNFLFTNVHVTAGIRDAAFKTLDGTVVQGGAPSMAVGEDIFCMVMPPGGKPFEIMKDVDTNAAIGDDVVVLGNAEGGGVVNTLIGKIVGIGPNLVEIDAPFVPGNSGSPIIHLKTGKVIGVATYYTSNQYDITTNLKLKQPVIRRFGYRIDSVKGWQPVNWRVFDGEAVQMDSITSLTDDLYDFFQDLEEHNGVVTPGRHTNPVIKTRIDDWMEAKSHGLSVEDNQEADTNFLSFLKVASQSDVAAAERQPMYDYFERELRDQKAARDQIQQGFEQIIQSLQK